MAKSDDRQFKILFVMDSLFTGGAEYSTLQLAGWLKQKGVIVRMVCLKVMNPSYSAVTFGLGDDVVTLHGTTFFARLRELAAHIREFNPDIIHSVLLMSNFTCRLLRLSHRRPVYVESLVNRTYDKARLGDKNVNRFALGVYRVLDTVSQRWGVDRFHAVTQDIANHFRDRTMTQATRIEVIYRGRSRNPWIGDPTRRAEIRREFEIGEKDMVFLNIGRHEFQKGQGHLLKAFARFLKDYSGQAVLLIAGREGHETGKLRDVVRDERIGKHVRLLGHSDDIQKLLVASDVFVLSSVFEGIGGVLIEAESARLPIISSDLEGLREVVEPDGNALMVSPGNSEQLSEALRKMAGDPEMRRRMGERSLELFTNKFEIEISHDRMMSFYHNALEIPQ